MYMLMILHIIEALYMYIFPEFIFNVVLKCHYDENPIFQIYVILRHKHVACIRIKNAVYCFQISLFVPEIFKFLKDANWSNDDVIHSTKF